MGSRLVLLRRAAVIPDRGTSMYAADEDAVREQIANHRAKIEEEHAFTMERVNRLRRFVREEELDRREREEWRHFNDRIYPLQQEIEVMIRTLADCAWLRASPPAGRNLGYGQSVAEGDS